MREDLQRRISAAIDSGKGVDGDPGLRELLAADPDAAAYAHDVARLGRIMREWPLPEPDDDAFEALASRIEQRLEDASGLSRIADPTAPPQFDDDDDLRDATAGLLGPVLSSGELDLESIPPAAPVALAPPPPPAARPAAPPARPPEPREIPKLVQASENASERFSFPSLPPPPGAGSLQGGSLHALPPAPRKKSSLGWIAGLAAAAAVGLGVVATTQMASPDLEAAPAAIGASAAPAAAEEVAVATLAQEVPPAQPSAPAEGMAGPAAAPIAADSSGAGARSDDARFARPSPTAAPRPASPAAPLADAFDGAAASTPRRRAAARADAPGAGASTGAASGGAASGGGGAARGALAEPEPAARAERSAPPPPPAASRAPAEVPDEDLPEQPERGEVLSAIQAVEPAVRACAQDQHGTASVRIVVAGSGRVTTATVSGQFAGTPVGSCVARAVRTARFPRFSSDRFEVTYPFQL